LLGVGGSRLLCKSCADKTLKAFGSTGAAVVGGSLLLAPYQSFLISVWLLLFYPTLSALSFIFIFIYNAHSAMPFFLGQLAWSGRAPPPPCLLLLRF
jgi:hypothetical protein